MVENRRVDIQMGCLAQAPTLALTIRGDEEDRAVLGGLLAVVGPRAAMIRGGDDQPVFLIASGPRLDSGTGLLNK